MPKSVVVKARTKLDIKRKAEEILKALGLSSSQAIGLFYSQIVLSQSLPFEKIPNETTQKTLLDCLLNRNVKKYSLEEFRKKFFNVLRKVGLSFWGLGNLGEALASL